jgi:hypothetical protein
MPQTKPKIRLCWNVQAENVRYQHSLVSATPSGIPEQLKNVKGHKTLPEQFSARDKLFHSQNG